jgi:hypothetical protein
MILSAPFLSAGFVFGFITGSFVAGVEFSNIFLKWVAYGE